MALLTDTDWHIITLPHPPASFMTAIGGHPLVAQTLFARGYTDSQQALAFMHADLYQPASAWDFPDMEKAVNLILAAIKNQQIIGIWGDFDADGQTATSLLVSALIKLGARVRYYIPNRDQESHGIHLKSLKRFIEQGITLLITCDTGISNLKEIAFARSANVAVIVTDHHQLPQTLPTAEALINPHLLHGNHPLKELAGVGVAFKLIEAVYSSQQLPSPTDLLDLVAVGSVADLAAQANDNRFLVQKGLQALRTTQRVGLIKIFESAGLVQANLDEIHLGFQIAPRLNAIGRLDDANCVVELLTTQDAERAEILTAVIESANQKRRMLTRQILESTMQIIEKDAALRHAPALVLSHPEWHAGILGIVANQLANRWMKPVILFKEENGICKGSARSFGGINITEIITTQAALLTRFGGHTAAAGLSMPAENLPAFQKAFNRAVEKAQQTLDQKPCLQIDAVLPLHQANSLAFIEEMQRLAPFGMANPSLIFMAENLTVKSIARMGKQAEHSQIILSDAKGDEFRLLWWNSTAEDIPEGAQIDLAYQVSASNYRGNREVTFQWVDARQASEINPEKFTPQKEWVDLRDSTNPQQDFLDLITEYPQAQCWVEGLLPEKAMSNPRSQLQPADLLIIWHCPPDDQTLQAAINLVSPKKIIIFGIDPQTDDEDTLIKQVAGRLKYAQNHQKNISINDLAGMLCQTNAVILKILKLIQNKGWFSFQIMPNGLVNFTTDHNPNNTLDVDIETLQRQLNEIRAYRDFFKKSKLDHLLKR